MVGADAVEQPTILEVILHLKNLNKLQRKYQFKGYMADEEFIEVTPAPMNQEPRFKNKIEEMIWRAKQESK